ncbi:putative acyl-activating enzyme 5 peroxisomal [Dissostichus eleginoides]|uniref:Acyl-activating enzyme 5 peroxisomal n=1 Tax=Dissostichus eleginoides TaxID=100907 RepID=A0AAD9F5D3_DISEL|nr:putative acyl-activating enzyme 5 peroxisomal [Dissostichus eleginoides]
MHRKHTCTHASQNNFFASGAAISMASSSPPVCVFISSKCTCDVFSWWEEEGLRVDIRENHAHSHLL